MMSSNPTNPNAAPIYPHYPEGSRAINAAVNEIERLRAENERLKGMLADTQVDRESWASRARQAEAEIERLRAALEQHNAPA